MCCTKDKFEKIKSIGEKAQNRACIGTRATKTVGISKVWNEMRSVVLTRATKTVGTSKEDVVQTAEKVSREKKNVKHYLRGVIAGNITDKLVGRY